MSNRPVSTASTFRAASSCKLPTDPIQGIEARAAAVTDYWIADGYLEYISPDGTRRHIPLEALDLQNTVIQNAPRGLPFVLRFAPAQNR